LEFARPQSADGRGPLFGDSGHPYMDADANHRIFGKKPKRHSRPTAERRSCGKRTLPRWEPPLRALAGNALFAPQSSTRRISWRSSTRPFLTCIAGRGPNLLGSSGPRVPVERSSGRSANRTTSTARSSLPGLRHRWAGASCLSLYLGQAGSAEPGSRLQGSPGSICQHGQRDPVGEQPRNEPKEADDTFIIPQAFGR
jgi:hypothetical protein